MMNKMSIADKRIFSFVIKWALFWALWAFIEWQFNIAIFDEVIHTPQLYCAIFTAFFAYFSAKFEAYYYHYTAKYNDMPNIHFLFTIIRIFYLLPVWCLTDYKAIICYIFMFPFFHDGAYYTERNRLNPDIYKKKWFAQSNTSTAKLTKYFTPIVRTVFAIIGIAALICLRIWPL